MEPKFVDLKNLDSVSGRLTTVDPSIFVPRRAFWITHCNAFSERGGHAHKEQSQLLVALDGWCEVEVTPQDGYPFKFNLSPQNGALLVPPMLWVELRKFKSNTIVLVLASGPYEEREYIRDREAFFNRA